MKGRYTYLNTYLDANLPSWLNWIPNKTSLSVEFELYKLKTK